MTRDCLRILQIHTKYRSGLGGEDAVASDERELVVGRGHQVESLFFHNEEHAGVGLPGAATAVRPNANFWATDGIAAMGLVGVLFASIVSALLFVLMNSFTRVYDTRFVVLCFLPFVITLLNQSMFSSFWSGGAFSLLLFFLFNRRNARVTSHGEGSALQFAGA